MSASPLAFKIDDTIEEDLTTDKLKELQEKLKQVVACKESVHNKIREIKEYRKSIKEVSNEWQALGVSDAVPK